MIWTRKCQFCLGGRDGATSKRVTKIGWRQTGRPRSLLITSTSTTTCLRIFRKVFTWFLNIWLSAFFCKPDSNLLSSIIWINPKRIHEQKPISIIVSFSVGNTHSTPIDCTHLKVFCCMGSPGIFFGGWRQDKAYPSLVWSGITSAFCPAPPNPTQTGPAPPTHCLSTQLITHLVPDVCSRQQNQDDWSILASFLSVVSLFFSSSDIWFFLVFSKGTRGLRLGKPRIKKNIYIFYEKSFIGGLINQHISKRLRWHLDFVWQPAMLRKLSKTT